MLENDSSHLFIKHFNLCSLSTTILAKINKLNEFYRNWDASYRFCENWEEAGSGG